jgi:type VI secretion system protein ImpC
MAQTPQSPAITSQNLLDRLFKEGRLARTPALEDSASKMLLEFLDRADAARASSSTTPFAFVTSEVQRIDDAINAQLNEVIHHPDFLELEGTWRGCTTWL